MTKKETIFNKLNLVYDAVKDYHTSKYFPNIFIVHHYDIWIFANLMGHCRIYEDDLLDVPLEVLQVTLEETMYRSQKIAIISPHLN